MPTRVSGGVLGGRRIEVPKGDLVRPTQDMVRQALFSMLATLVPESRFLAPAPWGWRHGAAARRM